PNTALPKAKTQPEEYGSFVIDRAGYTYQTEVSYHYAEALKTRKYIVALQEIDTYAANEKEEFSYVNSISLFERLKIKEWKMKLKKNQLHYLPFTTAPSQLYLNTFLCNTTDTILNEKRALGKKSEIGFTVDNVSTLSKFFFPANGVLSYKW
ncbi:hypothetical protein A0J61_04614, partial [Choanephora cucurbitarum]